MPLLVAESVDEDIVQEFRDVKADGTRQESGRRDRGFDVGVHARHDNMHDKLGLLGPSSIVNVGHQRHNAVGKVYLVSHGQSIRRGLEVIENTVAASPPDKILNIGAHR